MSMLSFNDHSLSISSVDRVHAWRGFASFFQFQARCGSHANNSYSAKFQACGRTQLRNRGSGQ